MDTFTGNSVIKDNKIYLPTPGRDPNENDLATDTKVYLPDLSTDFKAIERNHTWKRRAVLFVSLVIAVGVLIGAITLIVNLTRSKVVDKDNSSPQTVFKTNDHGSWKSIDNRNSTEKTVVEFDNWPSSDSGEETVSNGPEFGLGQRPSSTEYTKYIGSRNSSSDELKSGQRSSTEYTPYDQSSCKGDTKNAPVCTDATCKQLAANIQSYINESFDPCENFYKFSCAGWIDSHPVLGNASDQLDVLQLMDIDNVNVLKNILENRRAAVVKSKAEIKARDFYVSCMNQASDKTLYYTYLYTYLNLLKSNQTKASIVHSHEISNQFNYRAFMEFIPAPKDYLINKNQVDKSIQLQIQSRGTTLPQDHYLEDSEVKKNLLEDYHEYLTQIRKLSKDEWEENEVRAEIKAFVEFEKHLASIQPNPKEEKSLYLNVKQMTNLIPYPPWKKSFEHQMNVLKRISHIKLTFALAPSDQQYLKSLKALFKDHSKTEEGRKILKNHFTWSTFTSIPNFFQNHEPQSALLKNALGWVPKSTVDSIELSLNCTKQTMGGFPEVTARLFVLEALSYDKKQASLLMFNTLKQTYMNLISNVSWIDSESKSSVLKKLSALRMMNGYPESIFDLNRVDNRYHSVDIFKDTYLSNLYSLTDDYFLIRLIIQTANKELGIMTANAFYDRKNDMIEIPAGILQKPVFDAKYPKLISYAKLGVVMGHEMSHAFQKYYFHDCTSRICRDNPDDPRRCVEDIYDNFRVNHKYMVDGLATVEENFGDIAGFRVAYNAYKNNYCQEYQSLPGLQKFTRDQLFFISSAQFYCRSMGSKKLGDRLVEEQVKLDPHSPNPVRVLGTFTNTKEFAEAFNCPVGSLYNLPDKCEIF